MSYCFVRVPLYAVSTACARFSVRGLGDPPTFWFCGYTRRYILIGRILPCAPGSSLAFIKRCVMLTVGPKIYVDHCEDFVCGGLLVLRLQIFYCN